MTQPPDRQPRDADPRAETSPPDGAPPPTAGAADPRMPDYKGEPLDAERGPGLGCFWLQVVLLAVLLIATPISVVMAAPPVLSATMLIVSLIVLFFVGQTSIFLLRLVAADRRSRRVPRSTRARRTVGQLEEEAVEPTDSPSEEDHAGSR